MGLSLEKDSSSGCPLTLQLGMKELGTLQIENWGRGLFFSLLLFLLLLLLFLSLLYFLPGRVYSFKTPKLLRGNSCSKQKTGCDLLPQRKSLSATCQTARPQQSRVHESQENTITGSEWESKSFVFSNGAGFDSDKVCQV